MKKLLIICISVFLVLGLSVTLYATNVESSKQHSKQDGGPQENVVELLKPSLRRRPPCG